VICGDRHWQYCSRDPQTGLLEMGCGPINDQHGFGGHPGRDPRWHRYFGDRGGFLIVEIEGREAVASWVHAGENDAASGKPRVLYREILQADSGLRGPGGR
jgi:alkaline phosphatase D